MRSARFADHTRGEQEGDDADGHVDEEDPPPRPAGDVVADDHATDQRAGDGGDADDRAQKTECPSALVLREAHLEHRQHLREHQRCHRALEHARKIEHDRALRQTTQGGGADEPGHAQHEKPLTAIDVTKSAAGDEQHGIGQGVPSDHKLNVGVVGREVAANRRNRHIDDRDVEQHHEGAGQDAEQRQPPAWIELLRSRLRRPACCRGLRRHRRVSHVFLLVAAVDLILGRTGDAGEHRPLSRTQLEGPGQEVRARRRRAAHLKDTGPSPRQSSRGSRYCGALAPDERAANR